MKSLICIEPIEGEIIAQVGGTLVMAAPTNSFCFVSLGPIWRSAYKNITIIASRIM